MSFNVYEWFKPKNLNNSKHSIDPDQLMMMIAEAQAEFAHSQKQSAVNYLGDVFGALVANEQSTLHLLTTTAGLSTQHALLLQRFASFWLAAHTEGSDTLTSLETYSATHLCGGIDILQINFSHRDQQAQRVTASVRMDLQGNKCVGIHLEIATPTRRNRPIISRLYIFRIKQGQDESIHLANNLALQAETKTDLTLLVHNVASYPNSYLFFQRQNLSLVLKLQYYIGLPPMQITKHFVFDVLHDDTDHSSEHPAVYVGRIQQD